MGLARPALTKAMLAVGEDVVSLKVGYDAILDDMFHDQKQFYNVKYSIDFNVCSCYKKIHQTTASKHILMLLVSFES